MRSIRRILQKFRWTNSNPTPSPDLFYPTTCRWLWNEPRKLEEHTQKFDLKALEHVIAKTAGSGAASAALRFENIAEGGSNKAFLAILGDQRLIVKIPDPVVPPRLVTASEVATLHFLRSELELPVPKVFSWSDTSDNPVGCEYIILEEAQGQALNTVWSDLPIPEKLMVVDEILSIHKRLAATSHMFNGYGSLYFDGDASRFGFSRHFPVRSTRTQTYCIGPLADEHFIGSASTSSGVDCGPYLHNGNLFVSPKGKITSIVDWQGTNVLPSFLTARVPQFIAVQHDALLLELPENFSELRKARRLEVWERHRQSMLQQYYRAGLKETIPDLATLLEDKQLAPIRKQVELFARAPPGQDVDALFLKETLLRIQRNWSSFFRDQRMVAQCPIKIEGDVLINHQRDGRRYNDFQDLLKTHNIPVANEGWVPRDEFKERKRHLRAVVREAIETLESQQERQEFKNRLQQWNLTDWDTYLLDRRRWWPVLAD
ncbi:hypothetical protein A1O7_07458 [Cladophialophora yegresii CBS 114405]|uniref:Aminoglycoside phosphotransferase domain-containing protein n=1 Tax=Cladophialophora yegresii CBS 114405 TaxID=1182544 RepID=W9WF12_9EURO|nr:uncharacterized protein A1O7_07458 [Cladophialophora yegresii CBS 114405]EXJ57114.1 hypothetical protein A1O7_07458 [Cladophialophora yegresii CBS 114405]